MVHHAAQVICACMVGADGLTPFRRLKGRKIETALAGFGERVWLRDPVLERVNKFNPRCTEGGCLDSASSRPATSWQIREVPHGPDDQERQR